MSSAKTIQLELDNSYIRQEADAEEALSPGHLLAYGTDGAVKKHAVAGGRGLVMVALEDALQGKTVDDAYAADDKVQFNIQRTGTRFQGILKAGENVAKGDDLISDGAGRLIAASSSDSSVVVDQVMAYADEAVDLSGSGDVDSFIAVRAA